MTIEIPASLSQSQPAVEEPENKKTKMAEDAETTMQVSCEEVVCDPVFEADEVEEDPIEEESDDSEETQEEPVVVESDLTETAPEDSVPLMPSLKSQEEPNSAETEESEMVRSQNEIVTICE